MIEQNILVTAETKAIWLIFSGEKILQSTENSGVMKAHGQHSVLPMLTKSRSLGSAVMTTYLVF